MSQTPMPPREEWTPEIPSQRELWLSLGGVLRAVTAAMQPSRVIIGLLMIVALGTFGSGWDRTFQPGIAPNGLVGGVADEAMRDRADAALRMIAEFNLPEEQRPAPDAEQPVNARRLIASVRAEYLERRAEMQEPAEIQQNDTFYLSSITQINDARLKGSWESLSHALTLGFQRFVRGVISLDTAMALGGLGDMCIRTPVGMWQADRAFTICFIIVLVIVLALGGGAISRISATHFAGHMQPSLRESFTVSLVMWRPLIMCQLLPLVFIAIFAGILALVGLVMRVPVLDVLGGAALGIWLLFGLAIAFLLICYAAGVCMFIPAVVTERTDAAEAMQRSFAYVVGGPLHLAVVFIIALIGLAVGYVIVAAVAALTLSATVTLIEWGMGGPVIGTDVSFGIFDVVSETPRTVIAGATDAATSWMVSLWLFVVAGIVGGYVLSYIFSASSIIYLLMRRIVDGQAVDDLWTAADGQAMRAAEDINAIVASGGADAGDDAEEHNASR